MSPSDRFEALVALGVAAARPLERALYSLDTDHARASKELAAFLLGVVRSLEALDPATLEAWRARVAAEIGRDVLELCRRTGEPSFTEPSFLAFLRSSDDKLPG